MGSIALVNVSSQYNLLVNKDKVTPDLQRELT